MGDIRCPPAASAAFHPSHSFLYDTASDEPMSSYDDTSGNIPPPVLDMENDDSDMRREP